MNGNERLKSKMFLMAICLCVVSALASRAVAQCCDIQEAEYTDASQSQQSEFLGSSISIDGTFAVVGAPNFDGYDGQTIDDSGRVFIFTYSGSIWQQSTYFEAEFPAEDDTFGFSVAIDGDIAVIGSPGDDDEEDESGSVYVFENDGGWSQIAKLTASSEENEAGDQFGWSVDIDGDTIVIGAKSKLVDSDRVGRAYIFNKPSGGWVNANENITLSKSSPVHGDAFGTSVSIKGDVIAVGVPGNGGFDNIGAVNIFRLISESWTDEQLLTAYDAADPDKFGYSVAIDGDLVVAGAPYNQDSGVGTGSAYIFRYDSGSSTWFEEVKLSGCDTDQGDEFGFSTAIDGNVVVVSARELGFPQGDGKSYAYRYLSAGWAQVETLISDDGETWDSLGTSISLQNGNAVVGAPGWDESGGGSEGAFYGFTGLDSAASCNCPWDLNDDGNVSTADLLILFASWGTCSDCNDCPADLDGDCSVGTSDLLILFANWGQCVEAPLPIKDVQDCFDKFYPDDTLALIMCIEAIGE